MSQSADKVGTRGYRCDASLKSGWELGEKNTPDKGNSSSKVSSGGSKRFCLCFEHSVGINERITKLLQ